MTTVATSKMLSNPDHVVVVGGKSPQKVRLNSVHITTDGGGTATVKIFDSHDSTVVNSDEIARVYLPAAITNLEHDFHGALLSDGIVVDVDSSSGTVCVTVNYS
tara:strand:+ start:587 stop:898 length:312 start_codon:yes stop_codon:yes gene_type:complete